MKRFMKVVATTLCAGMVLSSGLFASSPIVLAADGVAINEENFPDEIFRTYVKENCDTNGDGVLSQTEIDATSKISVGFENVRSLNGIEFFTLLEELDCDGNYLTSLDVSKNTKLKKLYCWGNNEFKSLDVSKNTNLEYLDCGYNQLTSLDVSKNTNLEYLNCGSNQLTSLDVSKNTNLESLICYSNQLTSLDVSKNTDLDELDCSYNRLTSLDVSKCIYLTELKCSHNNLSSLDVSINDRLNTLLCDYNSLKSINIANNTLLRAFWCDHNQLTQLDISKNNLLISFDCCGNNISAIDISSANFLVQVYSNHLDNLFSNSDGVYSVIWSNRSLGWSEMPGWLQVDVKTQVTIDGVGINPLVINIDSENFPDNVLRKYLADEYDKNKDGVFDSNELCNIKVIDNRIVDSNGKVTGYKQFEDLSGLNILIFLEKIYCINTCREGGGLPESLTVLDLSGCTELVYLSVSEKQLTDLNLSGCTGLKELSCGHNKLTNLNLNGCTGLEQLYCYGNQLTSLDLSSCSNLQYLNCSDNNLSILDISKNTLLYELHCSNNLLTTLNLGNGNSLSRLYCNDNKLTKLDISNQHGLFKLCCYNNNIASLNIGNNPVLMSLFTEGICSNDWGYSLWSNDPNSVQEHELCIDKTTSIDTKVSEQQTPTSVPTTPVGPIPTAVPTAAPTAAPELNIGAFIDRCYDVALGREADEGGYNYWVDNLNNGQACGAQVGYGFIFSGEYINKNRTNEEFVTDLYSMYFGRTPDEGGFNYWVGLLNSGASREEIFAGFANSTEFDNLCADYGVVTGAYLVGVPVAQQGGVNSFVARLYNICLNRRPDQAGQAGWAQKLISGEVTGTTCAFGFVFSPEFIGKEPSNEEFVACMYRAFFGREADEAGFNAWVETLNGGGSYEDVFNGFTGSAEFANLCASYGIQA